MKRLIKRRGRRIEYTLIVSRARSTVLLQALPENKIRLYAPYGISLKQADDIVFGKMSEIDKAHAEFAAATEAVPGTVLLEGRRLPLEITSARANRIKIDEGGIKLSTTYSSDPEIREQLKRFLVKLALERLRTALDKWSPTVNKPYYRVTVREQKSRWGSCSSKQNLNFNWKLIMAPPEALEYVVVHELCHLLYFNHSPLFWREVERRMPDYKIWKNWLKAHGSELVLQ